MVHPQRERRHDAHSGSGTSWSQRSSRRTVTGNSAPRWVPLEHDAAAFKRCVLGKCLQRGLARQSLSVDGHEATKLEMHAGRFRVAACLPDEHAECAGSSATSTIR